jgi:hypothetical protein
VYSTEFPSGDVGSQPLTCRGETVDGVLFGDSIY